MKISWGHPCGADEFGLHACEQLRGGHYKGNSPKASFLGSHQQVSCGKWCQCLCLSLAKASIFHSLALSSNSLFQLLSLRTVHHDKKEVVFEFCPTHHPSCLLNHVCYQFFDTHEFFHCSYLFYFCFPGLSISGFIWTSMFSMIHKSSH